MESAQPNEGALKQIDIYKLKALRRILGMQHPYINRANTSKKIYEKTETKNIQKISEYYKIQKAIGMATLAVNKDTDDMRISETFDKNTLKINVKKAKRMTNKCMVQLFNHSNMETMHKHKPNIRRNLRPNKRKP